MFPSSRHGVDASLVPGMAPEKPLSPEPATFYKTIFFYGLIGIFRAGWIITAAMSKKRRNQ